MTFIEAMQVSLPLLLYLAGIILLVVLIILCLKLIRTMDKLDRIVDDVDRKVKSLNGIFNVIDFCSDKITSITNKFVDKISNLVMGIGKRKYNKKEEEDYE